MYISGIRVHNYKSFYDSDWIYFEPGINIISGQNNSGKTALLETISTKFDNHPHRSLETFPQPLETSAESFIELQVLIHKKELLDEISDSNHSILLPINQTNIEGARGQDQRQHLNEAVRRILSQSTNKIAINLPYQGSDKNNIFYQNLDSLSSLAFNAYTPDYSVYTNVSTRNRLWVAKLSSRSFQENNRQVIDKLSLSVNSLLSSTAYKLVENMTGKIYRFYAERMNIGICKFGTNKELNSNASNLAEVLNNLQSNTEKLREFNSYVSDILPYIKWITVRPKSNSEVEILVWSIDPSTQRIDLASPLSACGTGVSQVLSILYVLLTSSEPRTIIIDEPQSFLHPGAAKKLIGLLRSQQFSQHQYFISTHSPSVIASANPSTITLLRYQDGKTISESIFSNQISNLRSLLDEVGVRLSDIYGADNILWVEGSTEEMCFPLILNQISKTSVLGIQVLAIKNTGDLSAKNSDVIFDIYNKVSGGSFLFPPTIGFVLDREDRSDTDINDLIRRGKGGIHFIRRRMYENYLMDLDAIIDILNEEDNLRENKLVSKEVEDWIADNAKKYLPPASSNNAFSDEWLREIDAAKLLEALFRELSEARVEFIKTRHSLKLTQWLLKNKPEVFDDIKSLLVDIAEKH